MRPVWGATAAIDNILEAGQISIYAPRMGRYIVTGSGQQ